MYSIDYVLLDEEAAVAGRRKGDKDNMRTGPIPLSRPSVEEDDGGERDPEDTRDMLWLYLERQNAILDRNFAHQTAAIDAVTQAVGEIGEKVGEHVEAGLKAQADAHLEQAKLVDAQKSRDQKLAALLGGLLIVGLLVLAGATVGIKYQGAELNAGHGGP